MNLLTLVLALPLIAFFVALAIPRSSSAQGSRMWALVSSLCTFAASPGLLFWFDRGVAGEQFLFDVPWIGTPNIHFAISVNGVSLWLVLLSTFLTPLCVLASWNSIKDRCKEFYAFLLLPLIKPPYGRINAIDLDKGDIKWQVAHGETPDRVRNSPALKGLTIPRTGRPGIIGTLVTRTLLIAGEPILAGGSHVEDLSAQRKHGLCRSVARLFGAATRAVALDDKQFGAFGRC